MFFVAIDSQFEDDFGIGFVVGCGSQGDGPPMIEFPETVVETHFAPAEQFEAGFGGLIDVPLVFVILEAFEEFTLEGFVVCDIEFSADFFGDAAGTAEFADEDASGVADLLGVGVFVTSGDAADGVDVHASLVSEGGVSDVGLAVVGNEVCDFVGVSTDLGEPSQAVWGENVLVEFECEVSGDGGEVGVATPFAHAVDCSLRVGGTVGDGSEGISDGEARVVMGMDAEAGGEVGSDFVDYLADLFGQRSAIGVAQDDAGGAGVLGGQQGFERVFRVGEVAVEKVFGIVDHFAASFRAVSDGVGDHVEVFFLADLENVAHVEVPAFADDGNDFGSGIDEGFEAFVVFGFRVFSSRHTEGGDFGVFERGFSDFREECDVFGVAERVASLDVVDAELVETPGDQDFILQGQADAESLGSVAQCRVVEFDALFLFCHGPTCGALVVDSVVLNVTKKPCRVWQGCR